MKKATFYSIIFVLAVALSMLQSLTAQDFDDSLDDLFEEEGVEELAGCVRTVARKLGEQHPRVVLSGGLARCGPEFGEPLREAVQRLVPGAQIQEQL